MTEPRCHPHPLDLVTGELGDDEAKRVREAMAACPRCAPDLARLERTLRLSERLPDEQPSDAIAARVLQEAKRAAEKRASAVGRPASKGLLEWLRELSTWVAGPQVAGVALTVLVAVVGFWYLPTRRGADRDLATSDSPVPAAPTLPGQEDVADPEGGGSRYAADERDAVRRRSLRGLPSAPQEPADDELLARVDREEHARRGVLAREPAAEAEADSAGKVQAAPQLARGGNSHRDSLAYVAGPGEPAVDEHTPSRLLANAASEAEPRLASAEQPRPSPTGGAGLGALRGAGSAGGHGGESGVESATARARATTHAETRAPSADVAATGPLGRRAAPVAPVGAASTSSFETNDQAEQAAERSSASGADVLARARTLRDAGRLEEAARSYDAYVRAHPDLPSTAVAMEELAAVLRAIGRTDAALQWARRARRARAARSTPAATTPAAADQQ